MFASLSLSLNVHESLLTLDVISLFKILVPSVFEKTDHDELKMTNLLTPGLFPDVIYNSSLGQIRLPRHFTGTG